MNIYQCLENFLKMSERKLLYKYVTVLFIFVDIIYIIWGSDKLLLLFQNKKKDKSDNLKIIIILSISLWLKSILTWNSLEKSNNNI